MTDPYTPQSATVECVRLHDPASGLDGYIALHETDLGPAAGGCRFWSYADGEDAKADAVRLARGMTYKNALAGLPFSGGKAVLRRPDKDFDRTALFEAFGRAVAQLDGRYVTAEDVGTSVADMQVVASMSRHVAGLPPEAGCAGGDPSPWTAQGVFESMQVAATTVLGRDLVGVTVAVQGVGNVGADLCRRLHGAGARLVIADTDAARCFALAKQLGASVVGVDQIASVLADVFAPCALGGALDLEVARNLKGKLICGAANNQLASPDVAAVLLERGIVYLPDYVVNAGGIINVSAEYLGEDAGHVGQRVAAIAPRVAALIERAVAEGRSPAHVADEMAEQVIANAREMQPA
ncbi:Leu/Phe/Val dehydrogenase [Blastomonas fulva]|jgi:leucine dehydrogenase|uniref:Leu/Phe/Val dehydrogenase n=1 Tax=Blastomonas fulva TaxID=1550728 RepID=UPI003D282668